MVKFEKYKLEMPLISWSPMIHFQAGENGSTIRGSEVKPKLDRFIIEKILKETKKENVNELKKHREYAEIFQDSSEKNNNNSLDYKLSLSCSKPPKVMELNSYRIYYGDKKEKKAVFSEPVISIICFIPKLRQWIEDFLEEFFFVTNFGTMQSKGFGSFGPKYIGHTLQVGSPYFKRIVKYLEEVSQGQCYYLDYADYGKYQNEKAGNLQARSEKMFANILIFYSIMKSGRNMRGDYVRSYIYQYMHHKDPEKNIDNEKAFMKVKGLVPKAAWPENQKKVDSKIDNPKYVRALLGVGNQITFLPQAKDGNGADTKNRKNCTRVSIKHLGENPLERVQSPIFFKIIADKVFIAAFPVAEELWEQKFSFTSRLTYWDGKQEKPRTGQLFTPGKEEFNIQKFLKSYVEFYNSEELRNNNKDSLSHVKELIKERKVQECPKENM